MSAQFFYGLITWRGKVWQVNVMQKRAVWKVAASVFMKRKHGLAFSCHKGFFEV